MKMNKVSKSLVLNKETVATLNPEAMKEVKGGLILISIGCPVSTSSPVICDA